MLGRTFARFKKKKTNEPAPAPDEEEGPEAFDLGDPEEALDVALPALAPDQTGGLVPQASPAAETVSDVPDDLQRVLALRGEPGEHGHRGGHRRHRLLGHARRVL